MSDQSGPSYFQQLFEAAFRDYEEQTGKKLADHPLAETLQSCDTVESVNDVLREQTKSSSEIRGKDKVLKSLMNVLSVLHKLSSASAVGQHLGLPLTPVKAIHTGLGILLSAVKDVLKDYDTLAVLLESIEHFLIRLDIYTKITHTVSMTGIIVNILVEILSILALATKQLQEGKLKTVVKKLLLRGKDIEAVLQRLDRLTGVEAQITAAHTLEVVHGLFQNMRDVVDDRNILIDHVRDALEIIQQLASDMNKSKRDNLEQDIQRWLSPPDPWKNHNMACKSRHRGSAEWFLQDNTYSEWKASEAPGSLLWVHGKPGAGKSVLCSTIVLDIDAMRKAGLASLAFFYCDFRENQKKDLRGLLSSLLVQLCTQSDSYSDILSKFYSEHTNGSRHPSDEALAGCLKDLLKLRVPRHAPVFLVVDAVDECPNTSSFPSPREEVLNLIEELIKFPNLRICVTSRPEPDIKEFLDPLVLHTVSLHDESGQKRDIEEYIKSVINTNPKNKRWKAADKQLVINVLTEKANGMFRWVYCQAVYICGVIPALIRHALAELPDTLNETYERTLREINKAEWEIAHRLFQFVAVAVRPLRVEELAELLAFDFDAGPILKFHEDWRSEDPIRDVLATCPSFLAIVDIPFSNHKVVQFSHFSVKEFLTSARLAKANDTILRRYHISETPAHTLAARACLGYLLHLDTDVTLDTLQKLPFIEYSAEHCVDHARVEDVSQYVKDGLKDLFDASKPYLKICIWIHDPDFYSQQRRHRSERPPPLPGAPLHYAALWDLNSVAELLINEHSQNVNSQDFTGSATPLHAASSHGHIKVARRLLECGADVEAQNEDKETPLHVASKCGHLEVVCMLIERGAAVSAQNKDGRTPLHLMFDQNWKPIFWRWTPPLSPSHREVARRLIERGAGVSAQDKDGQTALHLASLTGQLEVARMLIEHDADMSAHDKDGQTALHLASQAGQLEVARMLIERGAGVSAQNKEGQTPLHLASEALQLDVARMLTERGANVTDQNKDGQTPLHLTLRRLQNRDSFLDPLRIQVSRMLIERGADVTAQNKDGQIPLHLALESGQLEVARMLIERGMGASAQNKDGQTPLHLALLRTWEGRRLDTFGRREVACMLIEHGADVSAQDKNGQIPLHLASKRGQLEVARKLIEHGADVSAQDKDGQTPFHMVSLSKYYLIFGPSNHTEVARMLIERGASVSAQNKDGQTPLHIVSLWNWDPASRTLGPSEVTRMLIEGGADVSTPDKDGQTPLHLTSLTGQLEVAHVLIEAGAGVSAQNKDGQTPLHLASKALKLDVARMLIERGRANVTDPNKDGQTPLHLALLQSWGPGFNLSTIREVSRVLIECGADVSAQNKDGQTPLHLALGMGQWEVACMLVEHGAGVSVQNKDGQTALHLASLNGQLGVARILVERGADASTQDRDGQTALHLASQTGHLEVARMLIEHGTDVSAQNKDDQTPLHLVSVSASSPPEIACMLIERGADASARDKDAQTPLQLALGIGQLEVACTLIERGADVSTKDKDSRTPLHTVSAGNRDSFPEISVTRPEVAHMLIECGVDASAQDKDGWTALHLASQAGRPEVARMLIERGAGVSTPNKDGQTPLHLVSLSIWDSYTGIPSHPEIARMLIKHGADVSAQDKDCQTPLHLASLTGQLEVARMLIEHGACVSAQNKDGQTPLHMVSLRNWDPVPGTFSPAEVARMLIAHNADVSIQDEDCQTALHLALGMGKLEVAHMLIEHGASVTDENKDGHTPFHLLFLGNRFPCFGTFGHPEITRMLIERGADASALDKDGRIPMDLASEGGHLEVVRMLRAQGAESSVQN